MYDSGVRADKQVARYLNAFAPEYTKENIAKVEEINKFLTEKNPDAKVKEAIRDYYEKKALERGFTEYEHNGIKIKVILLK